MFGKNKLVSFGALDKTGTDITKYGLYSRTSKIARWIAVAKNNWHPFVGRF